MVAPDALAMVSEGAAILIAGLGLAAGIGAALLADRIRIPGLLLFLTIGIVVGTGGVGWVDFHDVGLTRTLGTIGLALILFEGGLSAGWNEIRPVLGTALSLATVGTLLTSLIAGAIAYALFDLSFLVSLILGAAVAATDSAAIFAVLRGSQLRRRVARALEGESGMNDPVAILLVVGFIDWIQEPGFGLAEMAHDFVLQLGEGALVGAAVGIAARWLIAHRPLPTDGLYPVASIAAAAVSFGLADVIGGSGFLAVYVTALAIGTGALPGRRTMVAFHVGVGWVAQIGFFVVLGLLVTPSGLLDVALPALALSAGLILVARPLATLVATAAAGFGAGERVMLSWAGLRGAIPIWLATFPVIAGVAGSEKLFNIVFFVVLSTTLIQGISFEALARRLGLTTDEPALPEPLHESGRIRSLGGDVLTYHLPPDSPLEGLMIKELGLPRQAMVNVIVRDSSTALPPRGSTRLQGGDELHVLVTSDVREEVAELIERWRSGDLVPAVTERPVMRGARQLFSVGPWPEGADVAPERPRRLGGVDVVSHMRTRRDQPGALVSLADGRYAVTAPEWVAVGGRRDLARWCRRRGARDLADPEARAWWQEVTGALVAPGIR